MEKLSRIVREFALLEGACEAGIVTLKTLEGGPPSSDLTYVLPGAKSAISFAVAIDQEPVHPYLMKKNRLALEQAFIRGNGLHGLHGLLVDSLFPKAIMVSRQLINECKLPTVSGRNLKVAGIFSFWMTNSVYLVQTVS